MSKHDKVAKLKEYIKNFVIKELEKDEELDEASTTASAGAANPMGTGIYYDTPKAFSGKRKKDKKKRKKIATAGGYKPVKESFVPSGKVSDVFLKLKSKGFGNKKFGDISKELSKHYKTPGLADVMASMFKEIWMKGNKKEAEKEVLDWLKTVAKKSKLESVNEGKGVDKIMKMADDYSYGKIAGKTVDVMTAKLFQAAYNKAPQKAKDKVDKMNEKQLYIFMMNLWKRFGKQVRLGS